jgi:hypothetical protein
MLNIQGIVHTAFLMEIVSYGVVDFPSGKGLVGGGGEALGGFRPLSS